MQQVLPLVGYSYKSPAQSQSRSSERDRRWGDVEPSHAAPCGRNLCNKALPALLRCTIRMLGLCLREWLWTARLLKMAQNVNGVPVIFFFSPISVVSSRVHALQHCEIGLSCTQSRHYDATRLKAAYDTGEKLSNRARTSFGLSAELVASSRLGQ